MTSFARKILLSCLVWASVYAIGLSASEMPSAIPSAAQGAPRFPVYQYLVDGNSLLSNLAIEKAVSPHMGEDKSLNDVEAARAALEKAYHDAGYLTVVVSIPEQTVDSGEVALHVVEADIDQLKIKGAEHVLPSDIKAKVAELAEGNVPNFNRLQAQLAEVNRGSDVKVTPILRAGKVPGTVEAQLDVEDQLAVHGSVDVNNRQTPNTTSNRISAALRYDNLWQRGHSFGITAQISPQRTEDSRVLTANYLLPLGHEGGSLTVYGVHSRSNFAALEGAPGLGLLGNTDIIGTRLSWPLPASGDYSHSMTVGLDHKDIQQTLVLPGGVGTGTPITYVPLVASYTGYLLGQGRSTAFDAGITSGLRGLFGNTDDKFEAKRAGTSASFTALRLGLAHTQELFRWSLFGKLEMQLSSGPLIPSEQFTAGGAESVRGYLEGERAGDAGGRVTLELRTPQYNPGGETSAWHLSGLVFYDAAQLVTQHTVSPLPKTQRLRGNGFGLRLTAPHGITLEVDAAHALVDGDITRAGENRIHARSLWNF